MIDVLLADVLLVQDRSLKLKLTGVRELLAVFTIELVSDNPNENFVFHENPVLVFLEGDVELKSTVVRRPGVITLVAPKLEVALLQTLHDKEFLVVPIVVVLLEEPGESSLVRPLNTDPLECLLLRTHGELILNRQLAVNIVFDLLNGSVALFLLTTVLLIGQGHLEPVCHFENVSRFKVFVVGVRGVVRSVENGCLINRLLVLPLEREPP